MANKYPIEGELIELNVGGALFTTYKSTLCKYPGNYNPWYHPPTTLTVFLSILISLRNSVRGYVFRKASTHER